MRFAVSSNVDIFIIVELSIEVIDGVSLIMKQF